MQPASVCTSTKTTGSPVPSGTKSTYGVVTSCDRLLCETLQRYCVYVSGDAFSTTCTGVLAQTVAGALMSGRCVTTTGNVCVAVALQEFASVTVALMVIGSPVVFGEKIT